MILWWQENEHLALNLLLVARSVKIESFCCSNLKTPEEQCAPISRHALLVVSINSQPDLDVMTPCVGIAVDLI